MLAIRVKTLIVLYALRSQVGGSFLSVGNIGLTGVGRLADH